MEILTKEFALFVFYFLLLLFTTLQLIQIVYYRHKFLSFHVGFLVHCFFWALFRSIFFLLEEYLAQVPRLYISIYWIPINIQYSTFSFLIIYYAHLSHDQKTQWYELKKKYVAAWVISNALLVLTAAAWLGLAFSYDKDEDQPEWLANSHNYFNGVVFLLLVVVLAWHGVKVSLLMKTAVGAQTKLLAKVSWRKIMSITVLLFFIFTSRCVWDFVSGTGLFGVDIDADNFRDAVITFAAFTFWEIIPFISVLVLFGRIPSTTLGVFSKETPRKIISQISRMENPVQLGSVRTQMSFNDPRRYDSDDETTPIIRSSQSPLPYAIPGFKNFPAVNSDTPT